MNIYSFKRLVPAGLSLMVIGIALVAWKDQPRQSKSNYVKQDTVPRRERTIREEEQERDFDKELRQLEEGKKRLEEVKQRDWNKIQEEVEAAMKNHALAMSKQKLHAEDAMRRAQEQVKAIDIARLQKEINESVSEQTREKILKAIEEAKLSEAEQQRVQRSVKDAMERVKEEMAHKDLAALEKIKSVDIERSMEMARKSMEATRIDMSKMQERVGEQMEKAKVEMEKAKKELEAYQEMVYSMEKDNLLDTKKDYTIEYKNGELLINDKKQPAAVVEKYKSYFKKDMTIRKEDGHLNITSSNSYRHFD
ncbi:MAG: hypothetical protein QM731_14435 [Chitinophagaceae bacterium]